MSDILKILLLFILIVSLIPTLIYFHRINDQTKISEDLYSATGISISVQIMLLLIVLFYILIENKYKILSIIPLGLLGLLGLLIYTLYMLNFRKIDTTLSILNLVVDYISLFTSLVYAYKIVF